MKILIATAALIAGLAGTILAQEAPEEPAQAQEPQAQEQQAQQPQAQQPQAQQPQAQQPQAQQPQAQQPQAQEAEQEAEQAQEAGQEQESGQAQEPMQEAAPEQETATEPAAEPEADVGGAVGLATGAVGETFFIRAPQEYHLLSSELPGHAVYIDTTATGLQRMSAADPEAEGTVDREIADGDRAVGEVVELLVDRRGGTAALVIELDDGMRGGAREVAVAMGLVRMLPDTEDPAVTRILLSLDPVDLENAPDFQRPGQAPEAGVAEEPAQEQPAQEQPAQEQPAQ
jgi:DNA mismatch repair ATPase MutL